MNFKEGLAIEEEVVEAVRQGCMKLRGEIGRLTRENEELRHREAQLIQSAVSEYREMHPTGTILTYAEWTTLWCSITRPMELQVRAAMIKRGCNLESWLELEE